jgi:hypothetical protein
VLRQGPISAFIHGVLEYAAAVLFIAAPFIFGFDSSAATAVAVVIGVAILVVAATTEGRTSLVDVMPVVVHAIIDFALAGFLIASPFLFSFQDEGAPTAFFLTLGVVHLLLTIGTRFLEPRREPLEPLSERPAERGS